MAGNEQTEGSGVESDDPVFEEAAGWVARLSSADATEADRAAFEVWRSADPLHADAYDEMDALWHRLGQLPEAKSGSDKAAGRLLRRRVTKTVSGIALAAALGGILADRYGLVDRLRADLWSGVGEITHATLPDGSRIDLNTDTALIVRFTTQERRISLLRGEASFDVVSDPRRPFTVEAGGLSARAVGTRFFVRADGTDQPVGVAEGRVEVGEAGRRSLVSAGEAVHRGSDASLTAAAANVERSMAWRENRLLFAGQPLSAVLTELGRYRHGRILLLDRRLGERRVTGAFDTRDTDDALAVIAATMGVSLHRVSPLLVLVGAPF